MLIMSSVKMRVLRYFGTIKDAGLTLWVNGNFDSDSVANANVIQIVAYEII